MARAPRCASTTTKATSAATPAASAARRRRIRTRAAPRGEDRQAEGGQAETRRREKRAGAIEGRRVVGPALVDLAPGEPRGDGADRQVDEEDRAPADRIDEPAADERAEGAGDRTGGRPRADGAAARFALEGGTEQGQAGRHQQCGADALRGARGEQPGESRCQGAGQRGGDEDAETGKEHALSSVAIAGDAAEQDERAER